MSKNRSPREVCSMTDGMMRFDGVHVAPYCRGSRVSCRSAAFPFRESKSARARRRARAGCASPRRRRGRARCAAEGRRAACSKRPLSRSRAASSSASSPIASACSRTSASISVVGRSRCRAGRRPRRARARARPSAPPRRRAARAARSGCWPVIVEVGVERDAARLDLAREPAQQLARARLDERPGGVDLRGGDERVGDVGPELRLRLLRDLAAQARLDVGAQLVERVELARRARKLVVELRQHLLLDLLDASPTTVCFESSASSKSISFVSPALSPRRLCSISSTTAPRPSSTT